MSDFITLSSGRRIEANDGFIGISDKIEYDLAGCNAIIIGSGFDDEILVFTENKEAEMYYADKGKAMENTWTPEERKELAELMIERWKKFGGIEK